MEKKKTKKIPEGTALVDFVALIVHAVILRYSFELRFECYGPKDTRYKRG